MFWHIYLLSLRLFVKTVQIFCKSASKVTQKNLVLAGIEGKDLGPKFFLEIDLGVLEGQISGGLFSGSIFDPSVIGANGQCPFDTVHWTVSNGQPMSATAFQCRHSILCSRAPRIKAAALKLVKIHLAWLRCEGRAEKLGQDMLIELL